MKKLMTLLLLCVSMQVGALELEGVKLDDNVQVQDAALTLNGAAVRSVAIFKMYVVGLYLERKQGSAAAVLADTHPKRIALHVLVKDAETERFLNGFHKGIEKNHNDAQMEALHERLHAFDQLFAGVREVKRGDVIAFDWVPATGTHVLLNGKELGSIAGEDFYRALLSVWIGDKPVKDAVKKALLG